MYQIEPLIKLEPDKSHIPDFLPAAPFRMLFVAPSNSGKSLIIGNLLSKPEFGLKQTFKSNIWMFSPTYENGDPSYHGVNIKKENIYNSYDENAINAILNEQRSIIAKRGKKRSPHLLFVLDDLITAIPQSRHSQLVTLFFSGRHVKVSLIVTSQTAKSIPKPIRLNASAMIILRVNNIEVKALAEEQQVDIDIFEEMYRTATAEPYSFLFINLTKPISERYYERFDHRLEIEENADEN